MARRRWIRLAIATAVLALASPTISAGAVTPSAPPGPLPPGETRSHYLTNVDRGLLSRTGRADAADALEQGLAQALVVLDAGSPAGIDGSVRLPDTRAHATPADVEKAVVAYGKAWVKAKGPSLLLVVGTTNYGQYAGGEHGAAWATLVDDVAIKLPKIDVRGGLDAEQPYSTAQATRSWVEAYDASGTRPYINFGACICPAAPAQPANGWTTEDVYAVSVGDGSAEVLPEIYSTGGGNARAWGRLVAWSKENHPDQPIRVIGAMTEAGACAGPPQRSCPGIDLEPRPAWAQLTTALGLTTDAGPDLRYLTDISYLPQPGRKHDRPLAPVGGYLGLSVLVVALISTAAVSYVRRRRR